jgi:chromate transporter
LRPSPASATVWSAAKPRVREKQTQGEGKLRFCLIRGLPGARRSLHSLSAMVPPALETDALLPYSLPPPSTKKRASFSTFLVSFLPLGFVSFGGSVAHVALLYDKYVAAPLDPGAPFLHDATFVELFALVSALPGSGSTQLATALGATFGGFGGALVTFVVWQLPGALAMTAAGVWFHGHLQAENSIEIVSAISDHAIGLIAAAFAIVVIGAVKITEATCAKSDLMMAICIISASVAVLIPPAASSWVFGTLLFLDGCAVLAEDQLKRAAAFTTPPTPSEHVHEDQNHHEEWECGISALTGALLLAAFVVATCALILWRPVSLEGKLLKTFWGIGSTGFGGGQVVIPFLLTQIVETGWLPVPVFLSGFGVASALPGPMFNLGFFLAAALFSWRGAIVGAGLLLPGILLIVAALPFWEFVRRLKGFRVFLSGVTAGATGLVVAGVWMLLRRALVGPLAFALSIAAGAAFVYSNLPTPCIIVSCGLIGTLAVWAGIGTPYH